MKQILKNKKFLFSIVFLVVFLFPQFVLGVNCAFISNRVVQNGKVWVYSNLQCRDLREHFELLPQNATMYPEFEESMPGMNGTYCWDPLHVSNGPMNTWPTDDQNRFCSYHCCFTTAPETPNQVISEGQQTSAPIQEKLDTTPPKSKELTFTAEVGIPGFKTAPVNGALLKTFLVKLYSYLLYLSGVFAVIILILAGFQWVMAGGNQNKIGEAKQRIINALTGLVLLASSYLILYTINPELIDIKDLKIEPIRPEQVAEAKQKFISIVDECSYLLTKESCEVGLLCSWWESPKPGCFTNPQKVEQYSGGLGDVYQIPAFLNHSFCNNKSKNGDSCSMNAVGQDPSFCSQNVDENCPIDGYCKKSDDIAHCQNCKENNDSCLENYECCASTEKNCHPAALFTNCSGEMLDDGSPECYCN